MKRKTKGKSSISEENMVKFLENAESIKKDFSEITKLIVRSLRKTDLLLVQIKKSVKAQEECLRENNKTTKCVDETLGNVLLAIRQNEYLQAYYPAQHGFKEMKVVGKHPAKEVGCGKR